MRCPRCNSLRNTVGPGTGPHYARLACAKCGRFLCWLAKPTTLPCNDEHEVPTHDHRRGSSQSPDDSRPESSAPVDDAGNGNHEAGPEKSAPF